MAKLIGLCNIARYIQCRKREVRRLIVNEGFPAKKVGKRCISDEKWIDMWMQYQINQSNPGFCSSCEHKIFA